MSELENEIKGALNGIPALAQSENWSATVTAPWTREIKNQLCRIGRAHGWECYANQCDESDKKVEWLYDVVFWNIDNTTGFASSMPLAVESEWEITQSREGDFEKLVQSRAELRLWIVQDRDKDSVQRHFQQCIKIISGFNASMAGDQYLLAGLSWEDNSFEFLSYRFLGKEIQDFNADSSSPAFLKRQPDRRKDR